MEILTSKLNSYNTLSKTPKGNSPKAAFPIDQASIYNKENITDSIRKEKASTRTEENTNYQTRARSLERRSGNQPQPTYNYSRNENINPSAVLAQFGNFFNSPKNVEADFFKGATADKNSYRAKHLNRGLKNSFKQDEKSSQSGSSDQYLQSKIDQIINSSLSIKDRSSKANTSASKNSSQNNNYNYEEKSSEKLTLYTRLLNDMRNSTPKSKEFTNQDQTTNTSTSKNQLAASSNDFYNRNSESKKPYLDLKLSSIEFEANSKAIKDETKTVKNSQRLSFSQKKGEKSEENVRPERAEQQQQEQSRRGDSYQKQERTSFSKTLSVNTQNTASEPQFSKQPVTTKNTRGGLRYNDNQSIYESLSNLKKSLERPVNNSNISNSSLVKSTVLNGPAYNNYVNNDNNTSKEAKSIFKSITPKATTVSTSEVKNILQSFKNVLHKENKQGTEEKLNNSVTKKTLDDETYQKYLREGANNRNEEKTSVTAGSSNAYSQRPPSSSKSSKYRESSLNLNRRSEEKSTSAAPAPANNSMEREKPAQKSLKDFITQVPADGTSLKSKLDVNIQTNERPSYSNLPGHPQSVKNSATRPGLNDKHLTAGSSNILTKSSSTTTNSSIAQESKTFSFNSSLINKHGSRNTASSAEDRNVASSSQSKREAQVTASIVCQYYMAGVEKYLKLGNMENEYFAKIYREHFLQGYQAINFCKYLKAVDPTELAKKKVYLPKRESHKDKKTIIFDLDETLIHCNENANIPSDVILPIRFPHGDIIEAGINIRPYAVEALEELSKHFEIVVFTASHSCYANVVLDHLDPENKYIHHRLFRESCVTTPEGLYIKDLRIFANRNLKDLVIVDNAMYSFGYQVENGIPIIPFYYNKSDRELKTLVPYLKSLYHVRDVRDVNIRSFKLHKFTESEDHDEVIRKLFE